MEQFQNASDASSITVKALIMASNGPNMPACNTVQVIYGIFFFNAKPQFYCISTYKIVFHLSFIFTNYCNLGCEF